MAGKGYTTIALPTPLVELVKEIVQIKEFGYISVPELIKEATREKLISLRK